MPASYASAPEGLSIELTALGDFEGSTSTSKIAPGDARALALPFPGGTRAVSAAAESGPEDFIGVGSAFGEGHIDVLLWRDRATTELWPTPAADFPKEALGVSLGVDSERRHLLAAGSLVESADSSRAFTVDLMTGRASEVVDGMLPARAFATITAFGSDRMLVAGGVDPTPSGGGLPLASASEYDLKQARFDRARLIPLDQPRARHAAVVLANGDTLLVGGSGPNGVALATLEALSPKGAGKTATDLVSLRRPRIRPVALRLSDDRVFVGGGTDGGAPVGVLEWLAPDAHSLAVFQENLVLADSHAFVAMPDGGVLGVGVCIPKGVGSCAKPQSSVVWFRKDGTPDVLPSLAFTPSSVALVLAGHGAPWLYAPTPTNVAWKRFDPWTGLFDGPAAHPPFGPDADLPAPIFVDAGAFVWLERGAMPRLGGFRHDVRGPFARDVAPLLFAGREHVAPHRFPSGVSKAGIEYSAAGLGLSGTESRAEVADTDYADVDLELTLTSGPPPVVVLGAVRVGDALCTWPSVDPAEPGEVMSVRRRGTKAVLERRGARRTCHVGAGRLGVALSAASTEVTFVRALQIRR